jgi:phosphoserine aminotransferase
MSDTIEWLETIGKTANLRHASNEELAQALSHTDASEALKAAVTFEDRSHLSVELGHKPMKTDESTYGPAHEEEPDGDEHTPDQD